MDWFLESYYEADIKSGKITEADVDDMLNDFFKKLSDYSYYKADALVGDIGQIIVLGGLRPDGSYHYSKLTEQIMRAQARINVPDPKTILRISEKMPRELMEVAVECLESATGSPMFANDDVILPLLMDFGYPKDDAYTYCVSACWEPFIVGKAFEQNNMATFDFSVAFDRLMNDHEGLNSFDELIDKYISINEEVFRDFLKGIKAQRWAKDPLVSFITDGCNEKRKDISEGGAKYNNYGVTKYFDTNKNKCFINIYSIYSMEKEIILVKYLVGSVFVCLTVLFIWLGLVYNYSNPVLYAINKFFSGRLSLSARAFRDYSISLFGQNTFFTTRTWRNGVYARYEEYTYVDCSYLQILFQNGVFGLITVITAFTCAIAEAIKKRDRYLVLMFWVTALHSAIDPQLLYLHFNTLLFVVMRSLVPDKEQIMQRNSRVWKRIQSSSIV